MITNNEAKMIFGGWVISLVTILQLFAWHFGHDGAIFAINTGIIGLVSGSILGFEYGKHKK